MATSQNDSKSLRECSIVDIEEALSDAFKSLTQTPSKVHLTQLIKETDCKLAEDGKEKYTLTISLKIGHSLFQGRESNIDALI